MAVAVDVAGTQFAGTTSPLSSSTSINVGASATCLLVSIEYDDSNTSVSGITWGGAALTKVPGSTVQTTDTTCKGEFWGRVSPASGSQALVVTFSGGVANVQVCAISFTGSSTTFASCFTNFNSQVNNTAGTTSTVTIASNVGDYTVGVVNYNNSTATINQTAWFPALNSSIGARATGASSVVYNGALGASVTNLIVGVNIAAAAGGAAPFAQNRWPVPKGIGFNTTAGTSPTNINLMTNPIPLAQTDWPQTKNFFKAGPPQSLPLNPNLFTNPIPFIQTDWPNSKSFFRAAPPPQPYNLPLLNVTVAAAPFRQADWPIPDKPIPVQGFAPPNVSLLNYLSTPFAQLDWSTTKFLRPDAPDGLQQTNINLFTNPIPFAQLDWSKATFQQPRAPDQQGYNLSLYVVTVVAAPFFQTDWSTTKFLARALDATQPTNINLFQAVQQPFAQTDWSATRFGRPPLSDASLATNINVFTNPIPFSKTDWSFARGLVGAPPQPQPFNPLVYEPTPPPPQTPVDFTYPFIANVGSLMGR